MAPKISVIRMFARSCFFIKTLFFLFVFSIGCFSFAQQPSVKAFPTAEGFGKYATGGRGGVVIKVTNLNDSGPGSLRQALQYTSGPRTIVFEVGGTISLKSVLPITNGNVTIAGQTAPGDGILIKDGHLLVESSNVIIRHMRFRYGELNSPYDDSLSITAWRSDIVENIIIDHCSFSWANDENFEVRVVTNGTARNITMQNSIVSEAWYGILLYGPRVYNISFYGNLFAHNAERSIHSNYPSDGTFNFEMINNLIYGFQWATGVAMGSKFSVINNHYKKSSDTEIKGAAVDATMSGAGVVADTDAYISGNILPNGMQAYNSLLSRYISDRPFSSSGIMAKSANQIEGDLIPHVGASLPTRDAVDERIITQYRNGNGKMATIGVYPTIQGGRAPIDTDNDGMPDEWEIANGLDPNNPNDRNFVQPDGYTNLEYFLNGMSLKTAVLKANAGEDVAICQGSDTVLTASGGTTYLWSTGATTPSITIGPHETTTYTVTVYDNSGENSDTDEVTVTVNPLPEVSAGEDVTINSGERVTLTATGAESYRWSTGETTASIRVSPASTTTYTVVGTINGCEATDTVTVFSIEASVKANAGEDQSICQGSSTTLTATGGITYLWSTGETTASITVNPNETTIYTVTAYNSTGEDEDSDEVTVTVNPTPVVNAGNDVTINLGESITLTATGADSYRWNNGASGANITVSPTATRTYTVTGRTNGCEAIDRVRVVVINTVEVTADAGPDQDICQGASATLTASGGTNYVWNTGETTQSIEVSPERTTTYTVTVSDESGQSDEASVTVTVNPIPTANAGEDQTLCYGETTTLTATGGTSYLWNTGETTASIEVDPTEDTIYSVEVSANGCSSTDEVSVFVKEVNELTISGEAIISEGESTTLTVSGGDDYEWNTGEIAESITVSPEVTTTYSVSSSGPNGCSSRAEITVVVAHQVSADAGQDVEICEGSTTTLTATGGSTYLWNTGETTESIEVSPNSTTTYSVDVFDSTGTNSDTDEVIVNVNPRPTVDAGSGSTIDSGESVTLTATGATTYKWNNGETGASITVSPTATRTYTVIGTSNGCEATDTVRVTVTNTVEVIADAGADQSICAGSSTTLTASGGSTYLWNTGETTESIEVSPTSTSTYSVTAYDSTGEFSDSDEVQITVNALPTVDAGSNVTINSGESTTLIATGATSYKWSNGATGASIKVSPTATTTYTVIGTSNGCEATDTVRVTVTNTVEVIADAGADQSICAGSSTTLTASGGSTYSWSTGETTESIKVNPNATTTYTVTAYDSTGEYSDSDDVIVTVNELPKVNAGNNRTIESGESTTLTATGATSYKWSNGKTGVSITVSPTATTTYTVVGTSGSCETTASVKVTVVAEPQVVVARAGGNKDICEGSEVTLTATGGDSYLWSTGAKTASIKVNPKSTTKYTVTAYIGNASATDEAIVKVSPKPNVKIINGSEAAILEGEFITLAATGANQYKWSNGAIQPNIAVRPTKTTSYEVVGYINDCSSQRSIKVNVFEKIVADAGDDVAICINESTILTANGPANSEFLWSTGETSKSITVSPDEDTEYSVMVFHDLDSDTDNVMVQVRNCENSQIVDDNVIIEDDLALEFLIHPNPTYGEVHIKISGLSTVSSIHLYDLSGKSLYNEAISVNDRQDYNKTLNLSDFASGIYLLQLVDNQRVVTKKIVLR